MKNKITLTGIAMAMAVTMAASATQITGGIGFAGEYSASSFDLSSPGLVLSFPSVTVLTRSGSFTSVPITSPVTMISSLTVNPAVLPVSTLWSVGGFSFVLTSFAEKDVSPSSLVLYGSGILSGNDYDNTPGQWVATFNSLGEGTLTFSSSTAAAPDGGVTVMLLGSVLSGMALLRRKFLPQT